MRNSVRSCPVRVCGAQREPAADAIESIRGPIAPAERERCPARVCRPHSAADADSGRSWSADDPAKKKKVIIAVVAVVVVLALAFVGIGVMTARANSMKLAGSSFFAKVDDKDEEITVSVGQDNTVTLSARDTYYDETTKIVGTLGKGSIDGDSVSYPVANLKIYRDGKDVSWSDLFSMSESEAKKTQSMTSVMLTAPKNAAKGNMVGTWGVSLNVGVFSYKIEAVAYQGGSWSGKMSGAGMDAETFGGTWASQGDGSYHIHETQTYDSEFDVTLPSAR